MVVPLNVENNVLSELVEDLRLQKSLFFKFFQLRDEEVLNEVFEQMSVLFLVVDVVVKGYLEKIINALQLSVLRIELHFLSEILQFFLKSFILLPFDKDSHL